MAASKEKKANAVSEDIIWICYCRPWSDCKAEKEDKDEDEDEDEDSQGGCTCRPNPCVLGKPTNNYPDWTWILTTAGNVLLVRWSVEQNNRDQDNFGMYIYNDWNGYGTVEVLENAAVDFNKAFTSKAKGMALWPHIEGLGWFFCLGDWMGFAMSDIPDRNAALMSLLGTALLSTITVLIEEGSFKATDTSIRNLGLVLSFWLNFITDICDEMCSNGESDWVMKLVQMADEHGVVIDGPWAMAEKVQKVRDKIEEMDEDEDSEIVADGGEGEIRNWKKWTWKTEFATYRKDNTATGKKTIGGRGYDISKMSKAEKWQYKIGEER